MFLIYFFLSLLVFLICFIPLLYNSKRKHSLQSEKPSLFLSEKEPLPKSEKWSVIQEIYALGYEPSNIVNQRIFTQTFFTRKECFIATLEQYNIFYHGTL